jgi:hypothetical protein
MTVSKDNVLKGINETKVTSGFLIVILLISIHNLGTFVGYGPIYSWMIIALQLLALMLAVVVIGSVYIPHGSAICIWLVALFVLMHLVISGLTFVNIYYIYVIFLSPLVMYFLIHASSRRDLLFIFGGLSQVLAIVNIIPSILFKEGLGYSGLLLSSSMFGMVSSVFAYAALVKMYYKKNVWNGIIFLLWVFILLQTKHRAGVLALVLASATFIVLSSKRRVTVKVFTILFGTMVAGILAVVVLKYSNLDIVNKMFHGGVVSLENINFSGRLLIWTSLLDGYFSNGWIQQIIGNGIGSSSTYLIQNHSATIESIAVAHNEFIRLLFEYGVLGMMLYFIVIYNVFNLRSSLIIGLPILIHYSVEMMFSNVFFSGSFYLLMLIMARWYIREIEFNNRKVVFLTKSNA